METHGRWILLAILALFSLIVLSNAVQARTKVFTEKKATSPEKEINVEAGFLHLICRWVFPYRRRYRI